MYCLGFKVQNLGFRGFGLGVSVWLRMTPCTLVVQAAVQVVVRRRLIQMIQIDPLRFSDITRGGSVEWEG